MKQLFNSFYTAGQYLKYHWGRSLILIVSLAVIVFVPLFLNILIDETRRQLTARADATPLILGPVGSQVDLAMSSLYFHQVSESRMIRDDATMIDDSGYGYSIPLNMKYRAGEYPIVGTTLDYFDFRGLRVAQGRNLMFLGDAVIGSALAESENLSPGDTVLSTPDNLFDLAGQYPLQMNIVGVLAATGTADDNAVFVDLPTIWVISGLGHGHDEVLKDPSNVLKLDEKTVTANARLPTYTIITSDNLRDFHFHGGQGDFPITSVLVVPNDHKGETILLGRYNTDTESQIKQLIQPRHVIRKVVDNIFKIQKVFNAIVWIVGTASGLAIALVFLLSYKLRAREFETAMYLGCSRYSLGTMILAELTLILLGSIGLGLAFFQLLSTLFDQSQMINFFT